MREGRTSTTANVVAMLRGIASAERTPYPGFADPVARALLPFPYSLPLDAVARVPRLLPLARVLSLGLFDHVVRRTIAIDAEVRAATEKGIDQVVILGAGLDARAFRMKALEKATVFEVDHPATHSFKTERARRLAPLAAKRATVAVDFARESLAEKLERAGHDANRPTVWIWEGVTPYLPIEASRGTLDVVRARSSTGSVLLVTYLLPELASVPLVPHRLLLSVFSILGEPIVGVISTEDLKDELVGRGFSIVRDSHSRQWASGKLAANIQILERLAVAIRE